jgi:anion-transporting  ArsA/GET3 family ATPase
MQASGSGGAGRNSCSVAYRPTNKSPNILLATDPRLDLGRALARKTAKRIRAGLNRFPVWGRKLECAGIGFPPQIGPWLMT